MTAPAPAPPPFSPHGNGKRYHIHTFGCQMNLADSERLAGALDAAGYARSPDAGAADVLVYNTCSIRQKAEDKLYGALGVHAARKRRLGADLTIVVAGCVAAQEGAALLRRVPEIDLVMGPHHVHRLPALLEQVSSGSQVVATEELDWAEDVSVPRRDSTLSAWVNLIHGCNERCTYCIVPTTRGREQSRTPAAIRAEMAALGEAGYREVTLLGQNVDAYGRDLPGSAPDGSGRRAHTLADLLRAVHDVPGIARIRFATSHPRYFSQRLVDACADLPKLCEFFHVPFQSGDDEVLRRMARGYTAARYRAIVDGIRRRMPDASISGDAIVGFPGEPGGGGIVLRWGSGVRERVCTPASAPVGQEEGREGVCDSPKWGPPPARPVPSIAATPRTRQPSPRRDRGAVPGHAAAGGGGGFRPRQHRRLLPPPRHARRGLGRPGGGPHQERPPAAAERGGEPGGGPARAALPGPRAGGASGGAQPQGPRAGDGPVAAQQARLL